jgi:hypothetical protein
MLKIAVSSTFGGRFKTGGLIEYAPDALELRLAYQRCPDLGNRTEHHRGFSVRTVLAGHILTGTPTPVGAVGAADSAPEGVEFRHVCGAECRVADVVGVDGVRATRLTSP